MKAKKKKKKKKKKSSPHFVTFPPCIFNFPPSLFHFNFPIFFPFSLFSLPLLSRQVSRNFPVTVPPAPRLLRHCANKWSEVLHLKISFKNGNQNPYNELTSYICHKPESEEILTSTDSRRNIQSISENTTFDVALIFKRKLPTTTYIFSAKKHIGSCSKIHLSKKTQQLLIAYKYRRPYTG